MSNAVITHDHLLRLARDEKFRVARASSVVALRPEGFNWKATGAVPDAVREAFGWTKESQPVQKKGPKGAQKETTEGVAFRVVCDSVRTLTKGEGKDAEAGVIRLSLSGEGGLTVTLREGDAGYAAAAKILAANQS